MERPVSSKSRVSRECGVGDLCACVEQSSILSGSNGRPRWDRDTLTPEGANVAHFPGWLEGPKDAE